MKFRQLALNDLTDKGLLRYKRLLLAGKSGFVITHFGEIKGFILPSLHIQDFKFDTAIETTFALAAVDSKLFDHNVDCVYLKFRGRTIAGVLAPKFEKQINFPQIGNLDKILEL